MGASYLGFGYAAEQGGQFVAFGHLYNTGVADIAGAKLIRKLYSGSLDEAGARKAAHEYAADILAQFGAPSLAGSKVYFVSDRQGKGTKEIWVMDFDGSNQRRLTQFGSITTMPAVSPDGSRLAFTSYAKGQPRIMMYATETGRFVPFFNPPAPTNGNAVVHAGRADRDVCIFDWRIHADLLGQHRRERSEAHFHFAFD